MNISCFSAVNTSKKSIVSTTNDNQLISKILTTIVKDSALHARWLLTLAHLEYCGARKIIRYSAGKVHNLSLLQHAAEETRHAYFFRCKAQKYSSITPSMSLLGDKRSRRYLDCLDLSIAYLVKNKLNRYKQQLQTSCYLLTTWAIEVRARRLYSLYENILQSVENRFSLRGLLAEEENHLKAINLQIEKDFNLLALKPSIKELEQSLFLGFIASVAKSIAQHQ